jgi:hypothetical protein
MQPAVSPNDSFTFSRLAGQQPSMSCHSFSSYQTIPWHLLELTPLRRKTKHIKNKKVPFGSNFIIRFGTAVRGRTKV